VGNSLKGRLGLAVERTSVIRRLAEDAKLTGEPLQIVAILHAHRDVVKLLKKLV
jgi:hypothetical protein